MGRRRTQEHNNITLHTANTDPFLPRMTQPIPLSQLPRASWGRRFLWGLGNFFAAVVRKINQLIGFALAVLLLLLFTRFLLTFFELNTSLFAHWIFLLSAPLVFPFDGLVASFPYNGYIIDGTILIAIVVYALVVTLIRQFLKVLVGK